MAKFGKVCKWFVSVVAGLYILSTLVYCNITYTSENNDHRWRTDYIVVHHTGYSRETSIEDIDRYHQNEFHHGFAYTFFIHKGRVIQVHTLDAAPTHAFNHNHIAISVCLHGNYEVDTVDPVSKAELYLLLRFLKWKYPKAKIIPHGDLPEQGSTACCGRNLKKLIYEWQKEKKKQ